MTTIEFRGHILNGNVGRILWSLHGCAGLRLDLCAAEGYRHEASSGATAGRMPHRGGKENGRVPSGRGGSRSDISNGLRAGVCRDAMKKRGYSLGLRPNPEGNPVLNRAGWEFPRWFRAESKTRNLLVFNGASRNYILTLP